MIQRISTVTQCGPVQLLNLGTSNVRGRTQMWQHMDGSVRDIRKLLQLRDNCGFYCGILDHYAPAVVGSKKWNNDTNMKAFCTTTDIKAFGRHVLSVSDEAFIILVLVNSSPRWMAEIIRTETMVRCCAWPVLDSAKKHETDTWFSNRHKAPISGPRTTKQVCR